MTLDEAIKHCLEVAEENDLAAGTYELLAENNHNAYERLTAETNSSRCAECAADHRQLAEWLTELKELRNSVGAVKLSNMKEARELIRDYKAENITQKKLIAEYKRLLKAAVEDFRRATQGCIVIQCDSCSHTSTHKGCVWRYADEALALIGVDGDTNG
jgi:hypothetical protein